MNRVWENCERASHSSVWLASSTSPAPDYSPKGNWHTSEEDFLHCLFSFSLYFFLCWSLFGANSVTFASFISTLCRGSLFQSKPLHFFHWWMPKYHGNVILFKQVIKAFFHKVHFDKDFLFKSMPQYIIWLTMVGNKYRKEL